MRPLRLIGAAVVILSVVGCNSKTGGDPKAEAQAAAQVTVRTFLAAVRTGDDKTVESMLTPLALEETKKHGLTVAPPGSDTASFEVGEVELVAEDGAHVASRWTDIDEQGQPHTDNIVWMVRKEENGWRIVGMAAVVFPGEPPLFLDFENAADMIRKQELVTQEMENRAAAAAGTTVPVAPNVAVPSGFEQESPPETATRPPQQSPSGPSRVQ